MTGSMSPGQPLRAKANGQLEAGVLRIQRAAEQTLGVRHSSTENIERPVVQPGSSRFARALTAGRPTR